MTFWALSKALELINLDLIISNLIFKMYDPSLHLSIHPFLIHPFLKLFVLAGDLNIKNSSQVKEKQLLNFY